MDDLDVSKLPQEVRDKLAELDLELSEGKKFEFDSNCDVLQATLLRKDMRRKDL